MNMIYNTYRLRVKFNDTHKKLGILETKVEQFFEFAFGQ